MTGAKLLRFMCLVAAGIWNIMPPGLAASTESADPIQVISKSFPDSIRVELIGRSSIEFCPDNTCELFVSSRGVSLDEFKDFVYIFLYFFSSYYLLDEWRRDEEISSVARQILSKAPYQICQRETKKKSAGCLLRHLSRGNRIKLYFVRYDEGRRNVVEYDILEETNVF